MCGCRVCATQVAQLCGRHSSAGGYRLSLAEFHTLMFELATQLGPPHALLQAIDPNGIGCATHYYSIDSLIDPNGIGCATHSTIT